MSQPPPIQSKRRQLMKHLAVAACIVAVAAVSLVASAQEVLRTGRPLSAGGPVAIVMAAVIIVTALYARRRIRTYLDDTRPPSHAIVCASCGHHGAAFDRRCRSCGARLEARASWRLFEIVLK